VVVAKAGDGLAASRLLVEEMPDGGGGVAHDCCFVWDKVLARNWGGHDPYLNEWHDVENEMTKIN
jgi:hypothetical protein